MLKISFGDKEDSNYASVIKKSAVKDVQLLSYIKLKFLSVRTIVLDYEGDDDYLSFEELFNLCEWLKINFPNSRFYYTISVRSSIFDILEENSLTENEFLRCLFCFYKTYDVLRLVLVVGNKKYLSESAKKLPFTHRLETFVKVLISKNNSKFVYIGADQIFNATLRIMNEFSLTKGVFLLNPNINQQLSNFSLFGNKRLVIYALKVKSISEGLQSNIITTYLKRRGDINSNSNYNKIIKKYAIVENIPKNRQFINFKNHFWFLFEI